MTPKSRERAIDLLTVVALALAAWKLTLHFGAVLDLPSDDDVIYLHRGMRWKKEGVRLDPAWGPLYSMVYGELTRLWGTITAFYTFSRLLIAAIPIATYLLARVFAGPLFSSLAAFFMLIAEANWAAFPKVNHLATLLVVGFYCLSRRFSDRLVAFAVAGIGFSIAAYARPEFALPALLLAAIFLFLVAHAWRADASEKGRGKKVALAGMLWASVSVAGGEALPMRVDRGWRFANTT